MRKLKEIALAVAIMLTVFSSFVYIASAQTSATVPFGGRILSYVLPTPLCPVAHTLIFDFASLRPLGLMITPGATKIFINYNFTTPGGFVLGSHLLTPIPCAVPYPVMPVFQIGTS